MLSTVCRHARKRSQMHTYTLTHKIIMLCEDILSVCSNSKYMLNLSLDHKSTICDPNISSSSHYCRFRRGLYISWSILYLHLIIVTTKCVCFVLLHLHEAAQRGQSRSSGIACRKAFRSDSNSGHNCYYVHVSEILLSKLNMNIPAHDIRSTV